MPTLYFSSSKLSWYGEVPLIMPSRILSGDTVPLNYILCLELPVNGGDPWCDILEPSIDLPLDFRDFDLDSIELFSGSSLTYLFNYLIDNTFLTSAKCVFCFF